MQSRYVLLVLSCCLAVLTGCQTTTARDVTMPSASVASIPDNEPLAVVSDSHRLPLDTRLVMPKSEDELLQVLVVPMAFAYLEVVALDEGDHAFILVEIVIKDGLVVVKLQLYLGESFRGGR